MTVVNSDPALASTSATEIARSTRRAVLAKAAEIAIEYLETVGDHDVAADTTEGGVEWLHTHLSGDLDASAGDPLAVIDALAECIASGVTRSAGPRAYGYVTGGALPVGQAAKWLVTAWDQFGAAFDAGPAVAVAERVAMGWIAELLGFSTNRARSISGAFVTGSTMAHFTALAAARHELLAARGWDVKGRGIWGSPEFAVVVGADAHESLFKALEYLGLGRDRARVVDVDETGRMRPAALARLLKDVSAPALVCAQLGEINTGAMDPLEEIADITRPRGDWLHVDGAFGAWAAAAPTLKHLAAGIEKCDSLATDAHKMLQAPYDCGIVLTAHRDAHRAAMSKQAPYTSIGPSSIEQLQDNAMNFTPEMAREPRGVSVYAILRSLGREGIAEIVEACHDNAVRMAAALDADPVVTIPAPVIFNQVLIDCAPRHLDAARRARFVSAAISAVREDGTGWLGGTIWRGRHMMRVSVANWSTTPADIAMSAAAIRNAIHQTAELPEFRQGSNGQ